MRSIVGTVRSRVLDWAIALEKQGISSVAVSFDGRDRAAAAAASTTINIQHAHGVLTNVSHSTINYTEMPIPVANELATAGIQPQDIKDLEQATQESDRATRIARIGSWLAKHAPTVATMSSEFRKWIQMFF